jgi:hypothetical protein
MVFFLVVFLIMIAVIFYMVRIPKWQTKGIQMIQYGTYLRLRERYTAHYGINDAGFLAAAVTNQILCDLPASEKAKEFQRAHRDIIEIELQKIWHDRAISEAAFRGVFMKSLLARKVKTGVDRRADLLVALNGFEKRGFNISRNPILNTLIRPFFFYLFAANYLGSSPKPVANKENP